MTDWATIASLATAGGTLVLAVATFASVRSSNRSARIGERAARTAERSLLAGQRPLLVNSRIQDPAQKIEFLTGNWVTVSGGEAVLDPADEAIYMAVSIRNVGTGLAVMHGWHVMIGRQAERTHPPLEEFTTQIRDIYVAPGDIGLWQGAERDPAADIFKALTAAIQAGDISRSACSTATSRAGSGSSPSSRCGAGTSGGWRPRPGTSTSIGPNPASSQMGARRLSPVRHQVHGIIAGRG